jgi:exopolyphosphatase / guanosine-5'-triphosphate,3'-diphosphate pyrophosphatase
MPRASIDIGSNSLVFLVIDNQGHTIHDEAVVVGLGRGIGQQGMFQPARMDIAMDAFQGFAQKAKVLGVAPNQIEAVATSASRRAMNATTFFQQVEQQTGIHVEVISGKQEAYLTWKGALLGLPIESGSYAVVDLGGGSTEIVVGDPTEGGVVEQRSIEIGTVRLTEQFFGDSLERYAPTDLAAMRSSITRHLEPIDWNRIPRALIAVAGTATTLGAMEVGLTSWDRTQVHGTKLGRTALRRWIDKLLQSSPDERREWAAISPERADYLLAGACVLEAVCTAAHRDSLWISDGGVRHGVLSSDSKHAE